MIRELGNVKQNRIKIAYLRLEIEKMVDLRSKRAKTENPKAKSSEKFEGPMGKGRKIEGRGENQEQGLDWTPFYRSVVGVLCSNLG